VEIRTNYRLSQATSPDKTLRRAPSCLWKTANPTTIGILVGNPVRVAVFARPIL
jgi:hypothetical protein